MTELRDPAPNEIARTGRDEMRPMVLLDSIRTRQMRTEGAARPIDGDPPFDVVALQDWMAKHVEGYSGPVELREFTGGQSNPTYQLITPGKKYVLRQKPPGTLLPSAHAVDREHQVISALHSVDFPVPRTYGLCVDEQIIGTMFYIMEMVEGRILWDQTLSDQSPAERHAVYMSALETMAALHRIDYRAIGLGEFGRPGNYMLRQIDRWSKQYRASQTHNIDAIERLIEWLPANCPEDADSSLVHADYRLDNVIIHPTEPRLVAVLDWELSTIGNPLADFTNFVMHWVIGAIADLPDVVTHGIPTMDDYVGEYCRLTQRDGLPDLEWYLAYNMFRGACTVQGIVGRARNGTANDAQAADMAPAIPQLAQIAWEYAQAAGARSA